MGDDKREDIIRELVKELTKEDSDLQIEAIKNEITELLKDD